MGSGCLRGRRVRRSGIEEGQGIEIREKAAGKAAEGNAEDS